MPTQTNPSTQRFNPETIIFDQRRRADCLVVPRDADPRRILKQLNLQKHRYEAVLMVIGGAAGLDIEDSRLAQFFNRGISQAALSTNAVVIDGGTDSGVSRLMGQAVSERMKRPELVGIAPYDKVSYPGKENASDEATPLEPNHTSFVLVESDKWGDETEIMFGLAEELSLDMPIMTLLINGGNIAKEEVLRNVRKGWPLVVVEGSGRLADDIAKLHRDPPPFIEDTIMAEIIADGNIELIPLKQEGGDNIETSIHHLVSKVKQLLIVDDTLRSAWKRFASYDFNAARQKKNFERRQNLILILGVVATLLALTQAVSSDLPCKTGPIIPVYRRLSAARAISVSLTLYQLVGSA